MWLIERGTWGPLPYAATGSGPLLVVLPGISPKTGVDTSSVRDALFPFLPFITHRRLAVLNRRPNLPANMTFTELAAEHAEALRCADDGRPVDLLGVSTGGSIAQQLVADNPDVVRRLVLMSTGCRLGSKARTVQQRTAQLLRANRIGDVGEHMFADLAPTPLASAAGSVGRLMADRIFSDKRRISDLATTLEAEDTFDLASEEPIKVPTLFVVGEDDEYYPPELIDETAALIPDCTLVVRPNKGHVSVLMERTARRTVQSFIDSPLPARLAKTPHHRLL